MPILLILNVLQGAPAVNFFSGLDSSALGVAPATVNLKIILVIYFAQL